MCESPEQTSFEILTYLKNNPDAQDTLEGVVEWWVFQQKIQSHAGRVERALGDLVNRGYVMMRKGTDSRAHYRINRRRLGEIESLLQQEPVRSLPDCSRPKKGRHP